MSRRAPGAAAAVVVVALLLGLGAGAAHAAGHVSVTVDRTRIATQLGQRFVFRSTITNPGSAAADGLIAHLNIVSLRDNVYVDPEDWSSHRTRYLGTIAPGGSSSTTWHLQAVNAGDFSVYVAVLRKGSVAETPTTGPAVRVAVAKRQTLNSGGILPLAAGIPALLGFAIFALRFQRRR